MNQVKCGQCDNMADDSKGHYFVDGFFVCEECYGQISGEDTCVGQSEPAPAKHTPCEACCGQGWILTTNDTHGLRIEKCDACDRFKFDEAAVEFVVTDYNRLQEVNKDLSEALNNESNEPAPAKHTPGPWSVHNDGKCPCNQIWGKEYPVAEIIKGEWGDRYPSIRLKGNSMERIAEAYLECVHYGSVPAGEAIANARLIAAAPDLLEALKEILSEIQALIDDGTLLESNVKNHVSIIKANAAIAKATQQ